MGGFTVCSRLKTITIPQDKDFKKGVDSQLTKKWLKDLF